MSNRVTRTAVPVVAALSSLAASEGVALAEGEPWYNGCDVVSNTPAGYNFTEACNWHDLCIGGHIANQSRQQCDDTFHQYMNTICQYNYGDSSGCRFWSSTYYAGANQFGTCFYNGQFCDGIIDWYNNAYTSFENNFCYYFPWMCGY